MEGEPRAGTASPVPGATEEARATGYRNLDRLASAAIFFLAANVVLDVYAVVTDVQMVGLLGRVRDGEIVTFEEADALDVRMFRIGLLQALGVLITAIPFVMWFRRAYRNLGALGVERLRYKPGWAVGGWFVPFLNLARPKAIANDIWRATDPRLPADTSGPPAGAPVSPLLNLWWAVFIVSGFVYSSGSRVAADVSVDEFLSEARRFVAGDSLSVIAGILAIAVVRAMTARMQERYATRGRGVPPEASAAV